MAAVSADGSTDARHKTSISQLTSPPEAIPFMFPENAPHLIPTQCRTAPLYCDRRSDASSSGDGGVIAAINHVRSAAKVYARWPWRPSCRSLYRSPGRSGGTLGYASLNVETPTQSCRRAKLPSSNAIAATIGATESWRPSALKQKPIGPMPLPCHILHQIGCGNRRHDDRRASTDVLGPDDLERPRRTSCAGANQLGYRLGVSKTEVSQ